MKQIMNWDRINVQMIVNAMDLEHAVVIASVREQQEVGIEELYYKIYIYTYKI